MQAANWKYAICSHSVLTQTPHAISWTDGLLSFICPLELGKQVGSSDRASGHLSQCPDTQACIVHSVSDMFPSMGLRPGVS